MTKTPTRIPTNLRTLLILEAFGTSDRAMSATEINTHIGLPKQTVHRLCNMLAEEGFLTRETDSKRFRPARRLRAMGAGLLHTSRSHIPRHQVLMEVAAQVRETVNFVVPGETGMNYVDRVETDWAFRIQLPVGSSVPFHCTASGKTFMASLDPGARKSFVRALTLKAWTSQTHVDANALLAELATVAEQGYALDDEEFMEGMVAIAVPVRDDQGRFAAALAFHGPSQRMTIEQAFERRNVLLEGAKKLTEAVYS